MEELSYAIVVATGGRSAIIFIRSDGPVEAKD